MRQEAIDRSIEVINENLGNFGADTSKRILSLDTKFKEIYKQRLLEASAQNEVWARRQNDIIEIGLTNIKDATLPKGTNAAVFAIDLGLAVGVADAAAAKTAVYSKFGMRTEVKVKPFITGELVIKIDGKEVVVLSGTQLLPESHENSVIKNGVLYLAEPIFWGEDQEIWVELRTASPLGADVAMRLGMHAVVVE